MPTRSRISLPLRKKVQEIKIEFRLTILKPLHAKWLVEYYNKIRSENGLSVIINGWKASAIYDAIKAGSPGLQLFDPFEDISPLVTKHDESESFLLANIDQSTDELRENFLKKFLMKKILNGSKVTTKIMLILNVI